MQYHENVGPNIGPVAKFFVYLLSVFVGYLAFLEIVIQSYFSKRLLSSSMMQFLGTISYSLYIWHTIIMFGTKRTFESAVPVLGSYISFVLFAITSIVLSIMVSYVSYRLLEVKVARLLLRWKAGITKHNSAGQAYETM